MRESIQAEFDQIDALLEAGDGPEAAVAFLALHPADQADVLATLEAGRRRGLIRALGPDALAPVVERLEPTELHALWSQLDQGELARVLDEARPEAAADVLHALPEQLADEVLETMGTSDVVAPLLEHADESAGGIMSPDLITLRPDMTINNAIDYLRAVHPRAADPYYLYLVDRDDRLLGVVGLRELVTARPDALLSDLANPDVIYTTTETDQEDVLRTLQHYDLKAVPVVDAEGRLAGVATAEDLLAVAQQEATEDMFRMVGLAHEEAILGPLAPSIRRRLPWLYVSLATVFAAAAVVSVFESTLERAAVIAFFLPVVAGLGGNATTQTATLVVRGMATDVVPRGRWRGLLLRETALALIHGVVLGLSVAALAIAWQGNAALGLAVGAALAGNLVVAAVAGVLIPALLRALGADPALASSIIVTTVTDVLGFTFYLGIAAILIGQIA